MDGARGVQERIQHDALQQVFAYEALGTFKDFVGPGGRNAVGAVKGGVPYNGAEPGLGALLGGVIVAKNVPLVIATNDAQGTAFRAF